MITRGTQIEWRRDKVRELTVKGFTQRAIAEQLRVSLKLINKDLMYMRERAKENIQHYIDDELPAAWEDAIITLDMITKEMWEMQPTDNRELIQSRQLIKDCITTKLELIAHGTVVDRAIRFVNRNRNVIQLKNQNQASQQDENNKELPKLTDGNT